MGGPRANLQTKKPSGSLTRFEGAYLGGNGGTGSAPILGGNGGTGSAPIATNVGLSFAEVVVPATIRRTETTVTTTSSASRNVRTRFFILALLKTRD